MSAITCPECKFDNLPRHTKCLMCKSPLPAHDIPTVPHPTRAVTRPNFIDMVADQEEAAPTPSSRMSTTDVDLTKVIGWLTCEPLAPLPITSGATITIGRSPDCDLVLRSKAISRKHALVKGMGQDMQLEDNGSANGTFLNGKRTSRANLASGDVISIGPYQVEVGSNDDMSQSVDGDMEGTAVMEAVQTETGFLSESGLLELLQGIEFNRKTGTIKLLSGSLRGTIVVQEGRPLCATLGGQKDEEAVYAMLNVTEGRYQFASVMDPNAERRMVGTITGLLLEHSRRADMAGEEAAEEG